MANTSKYQLDHVIILLPYEYLACPPEWLSSNFTLSPGGRHADGKTENRLVLFRDGTYLELIAFIDDKPELRKGHWWDKPYGVVDFALTTPPDQPLDHDALAARLERLQSGISYAPPQAGGRRRPDGTDVQWRVTFPRGTDRGTIPFWCEDVTPRNYRVPGTEANTTHPCGALGMAGVKVEAKESDLDKFSSAIAAAVEESKSDKSVHEIGMPVDVPGLKNPTARYSKIGKSAGVDLRLSLVLQTKEHDGKKGIEEHIGQDGVVLIDFE